MGHLPPQCLLMIFDRRPVTNNLETLPDVQSQTDFRSLPIRKVGITDLRYPIRFDVLGAIQSTTGLWEMAVSLASDKRGTHMSRFLEILSDFSGTQTVEDLGEMCSEIKKRLTADTAFLSVCFPWFIEKPAPVSNKPGKLAIDVKISISAGRTIQTEVSIKVLATSLCPCSKQISKYGAHNQRCELSLSVRFAEGQMISLEELFKIAESSASAPLFSTVKREDEKYITEQAYENPKFCEDTVRELAGSLNSDQRIKWYRCSVENFESIHSHNAFAEIISE